uniref:60S ribosomal protein L28 n=1 Tax=Suricata suricatta TaxID=37032 RepID=A0A673UAX5_SURSU
SEPGAYFQFCFSLSLCPQPCSLANCKRVVVMRWRSGQRKPDTSYVWTTIKKNAQDTLSSIHHKKNKNMAAIHRASAIIHSQKPVMVKRRQACTIKSS